jgi:hypothetical protein
MTGKKVVVTDDDGRPIHEAQPTRRNELVPRCPSLPSCSRTGN